MRRIFPFFLLLTLTLAIFQPVHAEATVSVADAKVEYVFGEMVNFKARLTATAPITAVVILFRAQGEANTRSARLNPGPNGEIDYTYTFAGGPLRPFARVDWWFYVTLQSGEKVNTPVDSFVYLDNRFIWQTVDDGNLHVFWAAGDAAFGQAALDTARRGEQKLGQMLSVTLNHRLDIYIYPTAADLQSALDLGGQASLGGHASPDLGVALAAIAPGPEQGTELDRKIPHEMAHILTYDLTGDGYTRLPVWLREGLASLAEFSPNPDSEQALELAVKKQAAIPIKELCASIPLDMASSLLAYAESASFTGFVMNNYGTSGLRRLINAYADGLDCEQGPEQAFSHSLSQVETDWHASMLEENQGAAALKNLFPYLAVMAVIVIVPLAFTLTSPVRVKDE